MRKKTVMAGVIGILALFSIETASYAKSQLHLTDSIASVNGLPVSVGEFKMAAEANRHTVFRYFLDRTGAEVAGSTFWETAVDGTKPRDRLQRLAMDAIAKKKIEQQWAMELGLWKKQSHADFLKALREENERRRSKLARGEVIYGPQQYDEKRYADYLHSNLLVQLKNTLAERWAPDDATLRAEYARHQALYKNPDFTLVESIDLPLSTPHAQDKLAQARALVASGRPFRDVAMEIRTADSGPFELTLNSMRREQDTVNHRALLEEIEGLPAGAVSRVVTLGDRAYLLHLLGKKDAGVQPFSEAKSVLKDRWINRKMADEIEKRVKAAEIRFRSELFKRIAFDE